MSGSEEADYWSLAITWILGVPFAVWPVGAALDRALFAEHSSLAGGQVTVSMGSRQEAATVRLPAGPLSDAECEDGARSLEAACARGASGVVSGTDLR